MEQEITKEYIEDLLLDCRKTLEMSSNRVGIVDDIMDYITKLENK